MVTLVRYPVVHTCIKYQSRHIIYLYNVTIANLMSNGKSIFLTTIYASLLNYIQLQYCSKNLIIRIFVLFRKDNKIEEYI